MTVRPLDNLTHIVVLTAPTELCASMVAEGSLHKVLFWSHYFDRCIGLRLNSSRQCASIIMQTTCPMSNGKFELLLIRFHGL